MVHDGSFGWCAVEEGHGLVGRRLKIEYLSAVLGVGTPRGIWRA